MKTELNPNESVTKSGAANLQRGAETVGGKLFLTNERLIFEAHALNIQTGVTIVPLNGIQETTPCWTKFLNLLPLAPNSLAVKSTDDEWRFVLFGRKKWKAAIDSQRQNSTS